ncbi:MAG: hypothetical protein R6X06_03470 [Gammaproteobacteria bacterium]
METTLKHREILFATPHPDPNQARSAMVMLVDVEGIEQVVALNETQLSISYDVTQVTLHIIEQALLEVGYHLDNSLLAKMKRALYYYTEETLRTNLGCCDTTRDVFVNRYQQQPHGCRDERPRHWRNYL